MRKLIAIISIVAVMCLGLAIVSVVGDSTNVEPKRQHSARPTPGPGWLILNGRLINPPYEVVRKNDTILVNELQVSPRHRPSKPKKAIMPGVRESIELGTRVGGSLDKWRNEYGQDSAAKLALASYRGSPIIDTAFLEDSLVMSVYYSHRPEMKVGIDLDPPKMDPPPAGWAETNFERRRKRIESALNHKALVIFQNGQSRIIRYPKSETYLSEFKRISKTIADPSKRAKLIIPFVADPQMADSIAINFLNSAEK